MRKAKIYRKGTLAGLLTEDGKWKEVTLEVVRFP